MILPLLNPDIPGEGSPSDHSAPLIRVYKDPSKPRRRNYSWVIKRIMPEAKVKEFGLWMSSEEFWK